MISVIYQALQDLPDEYGFTRLYELADDLDQAIMEGRYHGDPTEGRLLDDLLEAIEALRVHQIAYCGEAVVFDELFNDILGCADRLLAYQKRDLHPHEVN